MRSHRTGLNQWYKKIDQWIVGISELSTALNFIEILKINQVFCFEKINNIGFFISKICITWTKSNQKVSVLTTQVLTNTIFQNNNHWIDWIQKNGHCEKIRRVRIKQKIVDRFSSDLDCHFNDLNYWLSVSKRISSSAITTSMIPQAS